MEQTEDAIHLKVEVPGMKADDLDVQVTQEAVMITGERKSESKSENNGTKRTEFRYGSFQRTIPLPVAVDNNQVTGDYQDGILTLELPKLRRQENKVTRVSIGSANNKNFAESQADNSKANASNFSGEASTENGGYGNQDAWDDSQQASPQQTTAS